MATYYVGIGGNDANDGLSWANRKETLGAVDGAFLSAGDTLYIGPGTYRGDGSGGYPLFTANGSSGNEINIIGDYLGTNTTGVKGEIRITGSDDDTGNNEQYGIRLQGAYTNLRGVRVDGSVTTGGIYVAADDVTVEDCYSDANDSDSFAMDGIVQNVTVRRCFFHAGGNDDVAVSIRDSTTAYDNRNILFENCIMLGNGRVENTLVDKVGGVTFKNCLFYSGVYGIRALGLNAGQTVTVNNCQILYPRYGLHASASGEITENYNNIFGTQTPRTNTSTGANSTSYPPFFRSEWWFESVLGDGDIITPFDLHPDNMLVELNSGTGAPSADARGTTVQGTYREWGPLEYDSTLIYDAPAPGGSGGGGRRPKLHTIGT